MTAALCKFEDVFLRPGEWYFGGAESMVRTTLGSCVAISLWHPRHRIGGMCHYMLPGRQRRVADETLSGRYADEAMLLLDTAARNAGTRLSEYRAKLFGGASIGFNSTETSVARRNIIAGRALVKRYGLRVAAESLGRPGYCQVIFQIGSGSVWVRHGAGHSISRSSLASR